MKYLRMSNNGYNRKVRGKMYLLFALILYLKTKGIEVDWPWYVLAVLEAITSK